MDEMAMDPQSEVLTELKGLMSQRMGKRMMPDEAGEGAPQNVNQQNPDFMASEALPKNIPGQEPGEPGVEFSEGEMDELAMAMEAGMGMEEEVDPMAAMGGMGAGAI